VSKPGILLELGRRVRRRRTRLKLTQEALAHRAELHWTFVGQVERGERNITVVSLLRLSKGLGCDPAVLVRGLRV
jgi:transcriptional regulator with XRE-family HTH domain